MRHQPAIIACTGLLLLTSAAVHAGPSKAQTKAASPSLSAEGKRHLLEDNFRLLKSVREIPAPVQKLLLPDKPEPLNGMADPGQPFQEGDVVGTNPPPFRRLVFAAVSPGYCLVYNEQGGIAYWQKVSLYRLDDGRVRLVWAACLHGADHLLTLPQLRAQISAHKYRETL